MELECLVRIDLESVKFRDWVRNGLGRLQRRALVSFRVCEAVAVRLSGNDAWLRC